MQLLKKLFYPLFIVFLTIISATASGQAPDTLQANNPGFQEVLRVNRPLSYVTFGEGFGNLEPLLFEARIASSFFINGKKRQWALQFSPHILMRMKREKSLPVENPSFQAALLFHHRLGFWNKLFLKKLLYPEAYVSLGLHHHSNGQAEPFFNDDGSINLEDGSFSTNFATAALTLYQADRWNGQPGYSLLEIYYERHLSWLDYENVPFPRALEGLYGLNRLKLKYSNLDLSRKKAEGQPAPSKFLANSRIMTEAGWIFGQMQQADEGDYRERLIFSFKYLYYPQWLNEIAFFAQFYRGQDYYNIRFERTLSVFRIGLISDPFNLGAATEVFRSNNKSSKK